jgi:hypothetical protein
MSLPDPWGEAFGAQIHELEAAVGRRTCGTGEQPAASDVAAFRGDGGDAKQCFGDEFEVGEPSADAQLRREGPRRACEVAERERGVGLRPVRVRDRGFVRGCGRRFEGLLGEGQRIPRSIVFESEHSEIGVDETDAAYRAERSQRADRVLPAPVCFLERRRRQHAKRHEAREPLVEACDSKTMPSLVGAAAGGCEASGPELVEAQCHETLRDPPSVPQLAVAAQRRHGVLSVPAVSDRDARAREQRVGAQLR